MVSMSTGAQRSETMDPSRVKIIGSVGHPMWVLGPTLGPLKE